MTYSFSTSLAIAALLVGHSLCAHAQLSPEQMQAARKVVIDGKEQAAKDLACPQAAVPSTPVKTQEAFDALKAAHEKQRHCVEEVEDIATDAFLERAVAQRFSAASAPQKEELVRLFQDALEPMRTKALDDLKKSTTTLVDLARPFLLKQTIQETVFDHEAQCVEPYITGLLSLSETPTYLRLYKKFDACIEKLQTQVGAWDSQLFVNKHFAQESAVVRSRLAQDIPAIKAELLEHLEYRLNKARKSRARQQAVDYLDSGGKTRMPEE